MAWKERGYSTRVKRIEPLLFQITPYFRDTLCIFRLNFLEHRNFSYQWWFHLSRISFPRACKKKVIFDVKCWGKSDNIKFLIDWLMIQKNHILNYTISVRKIWIFILLTPWEKWSFIYFFVLFLLNDYIDGDEFKKLTKC